MRRYLDYSDMGPYHTMINVWSAGSRECAASLAPRPAAIPRRWRSRATPASRWRTRSTASICKRGDEVLTTNQDYPRMLTTFRQRERREGIVLKTISFPVPPPWMDDLYRASNRRSRRKTKLILFCHITNRTGQIFPVQRICQMAHARNIPVIVDGAHAFSHFPFKISDLDCDYYGTSLHKWTYAPIGTGFLYVRKSRIASTWRMMASDETQDGDIRKFEEIGTHPAANHNAISEALVFNENIGIDRKAARLRYLRDRWAHRLAQNPKCRILHSQDPAQSCGIGFLAFDGAGSREDARNAARASTTSSPPTSRTRSTAACASRRTSTPRSARSISSPTWWRRKLENSPDDYPLTRRDALRLLTAGAPLCDWAAPPMRRRTSSTSWRTTMPPHAISAYGSRINQTPNIDRIAKAGHALRQLLLHELHLHAEPRRHPDRPVQPHQRRQDARRRLDPARQNVAKLLQARRLPDRPSSASGTCRRIPPASTTGTSCPARAFITTRS